MLGSYGIRKRSVELTIHMREGSLEDIGYDLTNQTAYLDSMLRWGLDWLIKASFHSGSYSASIS